MQGRIIAAFEWLRAHLTKQLSSVVTLTGISIRSFHAFSRNIRQMHPN